MIRRPDMSVLDRYDTLLFDMDGTLMNGGVPIPGAAPGVAAAREAGRSIVFATNNASRTPAQVVAHLATVGVEAAEDEVVTSPQIASQLLADGLEPGAHVLVVGGPSLADEIRAAGLTPVDVDGEDVVAVVQGWDRGLDWPLLAEGTYAVRRGARWMATNIDATLPTERGMAPGNGSMVAAIRHATQVEPEVAGKPEPGMFQLAARRCGSRAPLAVGDRLDTDIEGANRADIDSLLVLTGVSTCEDALRAVPLQRPTWILPDMTSLTAPCPAAVVQGERARCGAVSATWHDGDITAEGPVDDPRTARAVLALVAAHSPDAPWTGHLTDESGQDVRLLER
ncbi:HAD-IIA family hydrolase [Brachybacterium nesterenkovii]|uniref:HAD-IIA family hydrolase n=1 Tax=Brachybacterium nesterenkovii TaxID=47847 RepID=UPI00321A4812